MYRYSFIMDDFVSGVNLSLFSQELKRNFVDCFTQSFGADRLQELVEVMTRQITQHVIPGEIKISGSRAEETMTPTYAGRQVTYQPDNDYMYIIEDSCINESIYTESTKTPGFVSVKFENNKNNHEVIDSGLKSTENGFILSPLTFKMVVRTRIEIVQELAEMFDMDFAFRDGYSIRSEIIGPSIRLIFSPKSVHMMPSWVATHDIDIEISDHNAECTSDLDETFLGENESPDSKNDATMDLLKISDLNCNDKESQDGTAHGDINECYFDTATQDEVGNENQNSLCTFNKQENMPEVDGKVTVLYNREKQNERHDGTTEICYSGGTTCHLSEGAGKRYYVEKLLGSIDDYENKIKDLEVDFVPAIHFSLWPRQAVAWVNRKRKWPSIELVQQVVERGYHVVPKSSSDDTAGYEWRISFSFAENMILKSIHKYSWCKHCYRILKCMIKYNVSRPCIITTYHCKTLFLWTLERYPPDTWTEENLGQRYLGLLDQMLHALHQRSLQHYFIPENNLFDSLNQDFVETVGRKISKMRQHPLSYIYRKGNSPWNDKDTGLTIEEMLNWENKPDDEQYPM